MNRPRVLICFLFILLVSGCTDFYMICSLNPFYLNKNVTLVPEIEGRWGAMPLRTAGIGDADKNVWNQMDTTSIWKIKRSIASDTYKNKQGKDSVVVRPMDYYQVTLISSDTDTTKYSFKMVLFRVNNVFFADFMPLDKTGLEKSRLASENYFRIHTLARLVIRNNHPELSWLGAEYMKEMIENKRVRVNYRWVSDTKRLLLTGSSEQLTSMIDRYADQPRFIDWDMQPAKLRLNRIN